MIKVFITDDHQSYAEGLKLFLEQVDGLEVAGTACSGEETLDKLTNLQVDVVLLDLDMPGMNGEETLKRIKQDFPAVKVLIITSFSDACVIDSMKNQGAEGFRNKESGLEDILAAIKNIHEGYLDYMVKENRASTLVSVNFNTFRLTKQETKVVRYVSEGLSVKEIADLTNLSEHTIESHCKAARAKAGAKNSAELVAKAIKKGLI